MENRHLSELTLEEIIKAAGGTLDASNERSINLMIKLFKAQGRKMEQVDGIAWCRKMEEIYQIRGLPDEQREYIRHNWYKV